MPNSLLQVPQTPNQQLNAGVKKVVKEIGAGVAANTAQMPLALAQIPYTAQKQNPFLPSANTPKPINFATGYQPTTGIRFGTPAAPKAPAAKPAAPIVANFTPQSNNMPPVAGYMTNTFTTPAGIQATASADGSKVTVNPNRDFQISGFDSLTSDVLNSSVSRSDLMQRRSGYEEAVRQLQGAYTPSQDYLGAMKQLQDVRMQDAQLKANLLTGDVAADTIGAAEGRTQRAQAFTALDEMAATNKLQLMQAIREGNINAAKALVEAAAPKSVSVGTSLVSPTSGEAVYDSSYLYKPSAGQITGIASSLLLSGQAPDYATAYNMAQDIAMKSAQGQSGFTGSSEAANSPVYQNVIAQLQQGVPLDKVYYAKSSAVSQAYAQQAINDFLSGNPQYNTVTASAQMKANAASYAEQQKYFDTVSRAYTTAIQNAEVLRNFMQQNNINQSNVPVVNQLQNRVKAGLTDPGVIAAFQSSLIGLRQEYAQVLARGGQVTDKARGEADNSIPDNLSPAQLDVVFQQLNKEGANALAEAQLQIRNITQRMEQGSGIQQTVPQGGYIDVTQASW